MRISLHNYFILIAIAISLAVGIAKAKIISISSHLNNRLRQEHKSGQLDENIIRFNNDGKLKLVNFADLHYGEAPDLEWGPIQDLRSTHVTTNILSWEQPDFVVFTGDQVTGEFMYPNVTEYIDMLLKPLVDGGYKWASVYGNHDVGPNVTRAEILAAEQKYTGLAFTQGGPVELPGVTNYYIPVYPPSNTSTSKFRRNKPRRDEKPAMIWWFFDSQGGKNDGGEIPAVVDEKVVEWFKVEHRKIEADWGFVPGLAFFHIPTVEYIAVQEEIEQHSECVGLLDDDVTPQERNSGLLEALIEAGSVRTTFVGHDHGNAWCCYYKTIQVCYNRHTGYGGYGTWIRGARVIELDYYNLNENPSNYIRLENGTKIDNFPASV